MRRLAIFTAAFLSILPASSYADNPVVVELFTSQGCSSCPPADRVLAELADKDYVIALALHVDYWDYLGWKDAFAQPAFSARQRNYARAWNERSVYTPQMVVQGNQYMVGSRGDEVQRQIMEHESQPQTVMLSVAFSEGSATISIQPADRNVAGSAVYLVGYAAGQEVTIERGELRGQTLHYVNVVKSWDTIAEWDGASAIFLRVHDLDNLLYYAVIVQEAGQGRILAAARLED